MIHDPHQDWQWFLDKYGEVLYFKKNDEYLAHLPFGRQLRSNNCHRIRGLKSKPDIRTLRQTTVEIIHNWMIYSNGSKQPLEIQTEYDTESDDDDETDIVWKNAPAWAKSTLKNFFPPTSWTTITDAIKNKTCIAVTDGSFDPKTNLATACWILEGENS